MSYDGGVNFGLVGDYEAMPMLDDLARTMERSLAALVATAPPAKRRPAAAKQPAAEREASADRSA
jgi:hypothetical protein